MIIRKVISMSDGVDPHDIVSDNLSEKSFEGTLDEFCNLKNDQGADQVNILLDCHESNHVSVTFKFDTDKESLQRDNGPNSSRSSVSSKNDSYSSFVSAEEDDNNLSNNQTHLDDTKQSITVNVDKDALLKMLTDPFLNQLSESLKEQDGDSITEADYEGLISTYLGLDNQKDIARNVFKKQRDRQTSCDATHSVLEDRINTLQGTLNQLSEQSRSWESTHLLDYIAFSKGHSRWLRESKVPLINTLVALENELNALETDAYNDSRRKDVAKLKDSVNGHKQSFQEKIVTPFLEKTKDDWMHAYYFFNLDALANDESTIQVLEEVFNYINTQKIVNARNLKQNITNKLGDVTVTTIEDEVRYLVAQQNKAGNNQKKLARNTNLFDLLKDLIKSNPIWKTTLHLQLKTASKLNGKYVIVKKPGDPVQIDGNVESHTVTKSNGVFKGGYVFPVPYSKLEIKDKGFITVNFSKEEPTAINVTRYRPIGNDSVSLLRLLDVKKQNRLSIVSKNTWDNIGECVVTAITNKDGDSKTDGVKNAFKSKSHKFTTEIELASRDGNQRYCLNIDYKIDKTSHTKLVTNVLIQQCFYLLHNFEWIVKNEYYSNDRFSEIYRITCFETDEPIPCDKESILRIIQVENEDVHNTDIDVLIKINSDMDKLIETYFAINTSGIHNLNLFNALIDYMCELMISDFSDTKKVDQ